MPLPRIALAKGEPLDTPCPGCWELIRDDADECPKCHCDVVSFHSAQEPLVADALAGVETIAKEADAPAEPLPGQRFGIGEIVSAAILVLAIPAYFLLPGAASLMVASLAAIGGIIGITVFAGGKQKPPPQRGRKTAEEALVLYFESIFHDRWRFAHEALSGFARSRVARVPPLPQIHVKGGATCAFAGRAGVKDYWEEIFHHDLRYDRLLEEIDFDERASPMPGVTVYRVFLNVAARISRHLGAAERGRLRTGFHMVVVMHKSRWQLLTGELFSPVDAALARLWLPRPSALAAEEKAKLPPAQYAVCANRSCLALASPEETACPRCGEGMLADNTPHGHELFVIRTLAVKGGLFDGTTLTPRECHHCGKIAVPAVQVVSETDIDPAMFGLALAAGLVWVRLKEKATVALTCPSCEARLQVSGKKPVDRAQQRRLQRWFWAGVGLFATVLGGVIAYYALTEEPPAGPKGAVRRLAASQPTAAEARANRKKFAEDLQKGSPRIDITTGGEDATDLRINGGACPAGWREKARDNGLLTHAREVGFRRLVCISPAGEDPIALDTSELH